MSKPSRKSQAGARKTERPGLPGLRSETPPTSRALNLGNRFAGRGIDFRLPTTGIPRGPESFISVPELSPEVWRLFESALERKADQRASRENGYTLGTKPALEKAKELPRTATKEISILLVEDNPGHVRLMEEAFKESSLKFNMNVVEDGVQALEFLRNEGYYSESRAPDLILLDLNLPRKDGREVLAEIKADEKLGTIPVIVLSSSSVEEDVKASYAAHASCYISKPINLAEFADVVRTIENFWGGLVKLP